MHIADHLQQFMGTVVGNGQCAVFAEVACPHLGLTKGWRRGARAIDAPDLVPGTIIATFDPDGTYGNHTDGRSHAAIYIGKSEDGGLLVVDQWHGHPVGQRVLHPNHHPQVNDPAEFYVVET
jgi:hypothetical protein